MVGTNVTLGATAGHDEPGGQRGDEEHPDTAATTAKPTQTTPRQISLRMLRRAAVATGCDDQRAALDPAERITDPAEGVSLCPAVFMGVDRQDVDLQRDGQP
jgi:hypothetical protein